MDLNQARFNMIEQQIRPWEVLDPQVLELLATVRREDFVPLAHQALAFVDMEIPTGDAPGQVMLAPRVQARLVQDLAVGLCVLPWTGHHLLIPEIVAWVAVALTLVTGWQYYRVALEGTMDRSGAFRRVVEFDFVYSSTCPCSAELAEHARDDDTELEKQPQRDCQQEL
mgnify:CR=1 FL=1